MSMFRTIRSTVALAAVFTVLLATSASAVTPVQVQPAEPECDTTELTALDDADATIDEVFAALDSGEVTLQAPTSALDSSQAAAYAIEGEDGTFTSVTVPISGDYSLTSNLTVLFDSAGSIVQYSETLVSANDAGNFEVTNYVDGALASSQDSGVPFMTDAELQEAPLLTTGNFDAETQSTAACVAAVLGISGAFAALIVSACSGACALASIGIGVPFCVACIGAYATLGGASVTAVVQCF